MTSLTVRFKQKKNSPRIARNSENTLYKCHLRNTAISLKYNHNDSNLSLFENNNTLTRF